VILFATAAAFLMHGGPAIVGNDNRVAAGTLAGHVLHVSMAARWGTWHPASPNDVGIPMRAFAEAGKPPQIPGPLLRVPLGTEIVLTLHNAIPATTLTVHGLVDRPAFGDRPISVPYGQDRIIRFRAGAAGTYDYWATTTGKSKITTRFGWDSQLSGGFIVDPAGAKFNAPTDRVFIIGTWDNVRDAQGIQAARYALEAFNGRVWPYTERLSYAQGADVRWRWINTGGVTHPLHLHGFYFDVESRGDGASDVAYANPADRDREVTELIPPGATFTMHWHADRPGNWLFHCHIPGHTVAHLPFADMISGTPATSFDQFVNDYVRSAEMGGMVLEVTVRGPTSWHPPVQSPARRLTLFVESLPENAPAKPAFRYALQDGATRAESDGLIGPTIVLTQGEPVAITVVNRLSEPTSVHWHGMELDDSYFDGASGVSGYGDRIAPMISPGASFDVQFAPPHAGTFVYHTHMHDQWQFRGGLAGPLIVLPLRARFDDSTDHIVMLTTPAAADQLLTKVLVNGYRDPPPLHMHAGIEQRLRLINVTVANPLQVVSLTSASGPVEWRPIAIDGADLPAVRRVERPAVQVLTIGKTLDFAFTPAAPGDLTLIVRSRAGGPVLGRLTIRVE
jgi:FtsP/CotA-like multicopper oxidase with cupredoxin domain